MVQKIHTFSLSVTMKLINDISRVDRFDASWSPIEKREGQTLKQLKAIATVRSVGASTRIEGSKLSDAEVEVLVEKMDISKLEERDQQEVFGYYETLNTIAESYEDIDINENTVKNLHKNLLKYCDKDTWHRGNYKQQSNAVQATHPDGTIQLIFKTTDPGFATENAMKSLIEWYSNDLETLPVVKIALFIYDFLSIHPFQDGNGRLSRLLTTLLLLKHGYTWIQYISFEHEIEHKKGEYYKVLMRTQKNRPGEQVDDWIKFFLDCLINIQVLLMEKLQSKNKIWALEPKEKLILTFIENHPGSQSGEVSERLNMSLSTVKKILSKMVDNKLIVKYSAGAGTNYEISADVPHRKDLMFKLTSKDKMKEFNLRNPNHFIEITKIILVPLFQWNVPDEWSSKFHSQGIGLKFEGFTTNGKSFTYPFYLSPSPYSFKPVFDFTNPINLPLSLRDEKPKFNEYPMRIAVQIVSSTPKIDFDIIFVYNEIG